MKSTQYNLSSVIIFAKSIDRNFFIWIVNLAVEISNSSPRFWYVFILIISQLRLKITWVQVHGLEFDVGTHSCYQIKSQINRKKIKNNLFNLNLAA